MILLGRTSIRSYRWESDAQEIHILGESRPRFYAPQPVQLHLEITPIWLNDAGETYFNQVPNLGLGIVDINSSPPLSSAIKELIAIHGKDAVAVALDQELQKL